MLAAVVLGGWRAALWAPTAAQAGPTDKPVIAPGPEVAGAAAKGAGDVAKAQKLARAGKVADAIALLEKVAAAHPSVVHDCNLSLAYLRAGRLTEAKLYSDVSALRGATPPDWCGPTLAAQLATALAEKHYVPLALQITPEDATIEVQPGGVRFRGLSFVWLLQGTYTVLVSSPDHRDQKVPIAVMPPAASARIELESLIEAPPPIDAGVEPPPEPIDAAVAPPPVEVDAGVVPIDLPPPTPRAKWPGITGAGIGVVGIGVGALFHLRALDTKDRANALAAGGAAFEDERDRFGTQRALAISGYAIGAAGLGFAAFWWLTAPKQDRRATIGLSIDGNGAAVTLEGVLP